MTGPKPPPTRRESAYRLAVPPRQRMRNGGAQDHGHSQVERLQPGWIIGTYTADVDRDVVLGDLQARAGELRRDAA